MSNAEEQAQVGRPPVYDAILKSLLEGEEKQLVPYFLDGAEYVETLDIEVRGETHVRRTLKHV